MVELILRLKGLTEINCSLFYNKTNLQVLDLSHNKLTSLPKDIFFFIPNLTKIVLDFNLLTFLP